MSQIYCQRHLLYPNPFHHLKIKSEPEKLNIRASISMDKKKSSIICLAVFITYLPFREHSAQNSSSIFPCLVLFWNTLLKLNILQQPRKDRSSIICKRQEDNQVTGTAKSNSNWAYITPDNSYMVYLGDSLLFSFLYRFYATAPYHIVWQPSPRKRQQLPTVTRPVCLMLLYFFIFRAE